MSLVVGVKFCGNCNPQIDSLEILGRLKEMLADCRFVSAPDPKDVLLVLSGCPVDCAERPEFDGPTIRVAGETLELLFCSRDRLAGEIVRAIRTIRQ